MSERSRRHKTAPVGPLAAAAADDDNDSDGSPAFDDDDNNAGSPAFDGVSHGGGDADENEETGAGKGSGSFFPYFPSPWGVAATARKDKGKRARLGGLALLGLLHLLEVELKLLALKDVAVAAAALPGAGGDAGVEAAGGNLLVHVGSQLVVGVALLELPLEVVGLLDVLLDLLGISLLVFLDADLGAVVLLVPGLERVGINLDNGILHQGLGAHLQGTEGQEGKHSVSVTGGQVAAIGLFIISWRIA